MDAAEAAGSTAAGDKPWQSRTAVAAEGVGWLAGYSSCGAPLALADSVAAGL